MARLAEFQGKQVLAAEGITVPRGEIARTPSEAASAAARLGGAVVVKAQAWTTGRAGKGLIRFVESVEDAEQAAARVAIQRLTSLQPPDSQG